MTRIVDVHHPEIGKKLLDQCLTRFYWLRKVRGLRKRPSTSELVDWIGALLAAGVQPGQLAEEIPFLGALIKKEEDVEAVGKAMSGSTGRWPRDDA
jgi:MoxR-like ATPase